MGVLNIPQVPQGDSGSGGQILSALAQMLLKSKLEKPEAVDQSKLNKLLADTAYGKLMGGGETGGYERTELEKLMAAGDPNIYKDYRKTVDESAVGSSKAEYQRIKGIPDQKENATNLKSYMLGMEPTLADPASKSVVTMSKDRKTGELIPKVGGDAYSISRDKLGDPIGKPEPTVAYGAAGQPGMGQLVGPLEDNPSKGVVFVPSRGGGETKTIDLQGRTSKRNLDSLSANAKASLASARIAYNGIAGAEKVYNEALKGVTGPVSGRAASAYAMVANSPEVTNLKQKLGRTLASVLRAESGLVVTDTERAFYENTLLPMLKNPQANFEVLLKETKAWIQDIHDSNVDILRESNTESPQKLSEVQQKATPPQPQGGQGVVWRRNAQGKLERVQ